MRCSFSLTTSFTYIFISVFKHFHFKPWINWRHRSSVMICWFSSVPVHFGCTPRLKLTVYVRGKMHLWWHAFPTSEVKCVSGGMHCLSKRRNDKMRTSHMIDKPCGLISWRYGSVKRILPPNYGKCLNWTPRAIYIYIYIYIYIFQWSVCMGLCGRCFVVSLLLRGHMAHLTQLVYRVPPHHDNALLHPFE